MTMKIIVRDAKNPAAPFYAIVDDEDYERMNQFTWHAVRREGKKNTYAQTNVRVEGKKTTKRMHQLITGFRQTDHANGIGLDNRRENLRDSNTSQNAANSRPRKGASKFKGVSWHKANQKWVAAIRCEKQTYIGSFDSEVEAAKAYDAKAKELFGEFARTNF